MGRSLLAIALLLSLSAGAQSGPSFTELRTIPRATLRKYLGNDSSARMLGPSATGIHYLLPFYKALYHEREWLKEDSLAYYEDLSQAFASVGDVKAVAELRKSTDEKLSPEEKAEAKKLVDSTKATVYADARETILSRARGSRVVMINEASDQPLHRVFAASLLETMYQQGFRYLAMEMLYNRGRSITKADASAGWLVTEPMAAALVRRALEIGYTLVAYEDTIPSHTVKQREYAQAENLAALLKKDPNAKLLVYAGYGHIEEAALSDDYIPMAAYFKIITGIDPLTIDQTHMTEGGSSAFEAEVYRQWVRRHPLTQSSVVLLNNQPIDVTGMVLNDIYVVHPPVKYVNERPVWMGTSGRKEIPVTAAYRSAFLVQAYPLSDYSDQKAGMLIPSDQTYNNAPNGLYYLYLAKGKYKLVFRDKAYAILGTKDIEVN